MNNHLPAILTAIDYIEDNLKDNLNMGDVAKHVGFSKYHFSRVFKELTSLNPYDYYRGRKVTKALEYMEQNQCKIIEAAFEYGFNSPEVFTRSCLSSLGQSPSQIKKQIQAGSFIGFESLTEAKLNAYKSLDDINIESILLPSIIIKGYTYTSHDFYGLEKWDIPVLEPFTTSNQAVYHLHWQSLEDPLLFHHLIGTSIDMEETFDEDNFTSYVYKKIPGREYLIFPLIEDGKELKLMKDYIYEYYTPQNKYMAERFFNIEVLSFDKQRKLQKSKLYIPGTKKRRAL